MKGLKQFLKRILYPGTGGGAVFSSQPQSYNVAQTVSVQALGDVAGHLILPLPVNDGNQVTEYQMPTKFFADETYGNKYEAAAFNLGSGEIFRVEREYRIKRMPTSQLVGNFNLSDYLSNGNLDKRYLVENRFIKSSLPEVKKIAEDIVQKHKKLSDALNAINGYVISSLRYGNPQTGLYSVTEALSGQPVDCGGFDTLFASICLALGIPARMVSGFWLGYEKNGMHDWLEVQLPDGRWLPADPSVEALRKAGRIKKSGGLGFVGSDRAVFSYGCDIQLDNQFGYAVDILQVPFVLPKSQQVKVGVVSKLKSHII